ncbi:27054_t:CDS:2 [Gigaspora margarita]|uniref:27054_t:CDS:1 n=1 Tax=Gigaspora margarita TaxID=4874 RepID=A0ABN7V2Q4_GIGMA|nr:27054_t:CDS:2 [Gigaspora margarita]
MEPKKYATIHSLLKQEQREKNYLRNLLKISKKEAEFIYEDQELKKAYKQISQDEEKKKTN